MTRRMPSFREASRIRISDSTFSRNERSGCFWHSPISASPTRSITISLPRIPASIFREYRTPHPDVRELTDFDGPRDVRARKNGNVGVNHAVVAHRRGGIDACAIIDGGEWVDDRPRHDGDPGADLGGARDRGPGVDRLDYREPCGMTSFGDRRPGLVVADPQSDRTDLELFGLFTDVRANRMNREATNHHPILR